MKKSHAMSAAVALALACGDAGAQATGNYATDLSQVYEAAQFVRVVSEACAAIHAENRPANEAAYGAWRKRHQALLDDLERRFVAMVRRASKDDKDYAKNYGKYGGEVLHHREGMKDQFLAQRPEDIDRQCREFPEFLKGANADLRSRYAEELKTIRKRKQ